MDTNQIDEDQYSRQLITIGIDAMKNMANKSILISGLGGTGVEIAKNVILCGVNSVTIHDTENTTMNDLGSQFYLNEGSIGKNRASESLEKLSELNPYVTVSASTDELTNDFVKNFNCVVLTSPIPYKKLFSLSKFCHENSISFILAMTRGVFGFIYNDFGPKFTIQDPLKDKPTEFLIDSISNDKEGIVKVNSHFSHNISDNSYVTFNHIEGMTELNGKEFRAKFIDLTSFSIGDTSQFHPYDNTASSGYGKQVIKPMTMEFKELNEALNSPIYSESDYGHLERQPQVIIAFFSLFKSIEENNLSEENILKNANIINKDFNLAEKVDEDLIREFLREDTVISPTASIIGGMAGQEAIKSVTSKFIPLEMFFTFADIEALPPINVRSSHTVKNDRYDGYRLVFGDQQFDAMTKLRYFMVGAGAIGCELLKNWCMMGVGIDGQVFVTDRDSIEKSNLNRQFLFRERDITKPKSICAAEAVRSMNPDFKVEAQTNYVGPDSENIYNPIFYNSLSGICNALDNIETRSYNDRQAVYYNIPLLESATEGPRGKVNFFVPGLTNSYNTKKPRPTNSVPVCTIKSFPYNINHCAIWAVDQFAGYFTEEPTKVNKFVSYSKYVKELWHSDRIGLIENLKLFKKILVDNRATSFEDIVKLARLQFEEMFNYTIKDIIHLYPEDLMGESGPYWSGERRFPTPLQYDAKNDFHASFIRSATKLFGIRNQVQLTDEQIQKSPEIAQGIEVPEWQPPAKTDNNTKESEAPEGQPPAKPDDNTEESEEEKNKRQKRICRSLLDEIKPFKKELVIQKFEKDDSTNGQIDFIAAAANLRAENYKINTEDTLVIKRIAGNIIPAIATTTAIVCGFVSIGMYKVHSVTPKDLYDFKDADINIAINRNILYSPASADFEKIVVKNAEGKVTNEYKFTFWDKWIIEGDLTCREFMDEFKKKYNLTVISLAVSENICVSDLFPNAIIEFGDQKITDIYHKRLKHELIPGKLIELSVNLMDDGNNIIEKTPGIFLKYF